MSKGATLARDLQRLGPLAILAVLLFAQPVAAIITMTELGGLDGSSSFPWDINDADQVVGVSGAHAFLWEAGVMTDLGTLGGPQSDARAINNAGQVVGLASTATLARFHAFLWEAGVMTDLGVLGGVGYVVEGIQYGIASYAIDINEIGQVTGTSSTDSDQGHAFLWTPGGTDGVPSNPQMKDLGALAGGFSEAFDINNLGQVAGTSLVAVAPPPFLTTTYHAVLWDNDGIIDLGTLGGDSSFGIAINDLGQVVGFSLPAPGTSLYGNHAFLWTPGGTDGVPSNPQMKDLGPANPPPEAPRFRIMINDAGQVAFDAVTPAGIRGVLWEDDVMTDLGAGEAAGVFDLNNLGQVVGGTGEHAFLWEDGVMTDLHTLGGLLSVPSSEWSIALLLNDDGDAVGLIRTPLPDGNEEERTILWRSLTAQEATGPIVEQAESVFASSQLPGPVGNGLIHRLDAAAIQLENGNRCAAIRMLESFIRNVEVWMDFGRIQQLEGQSLIDSVIALIESLGGPC